MSSEITIRRAATPGDYRALQQAQRRAWGIAEEEYIVPIATMVGAQLHGGLVLGAFLPTGEAVGVSFAFLGRLDDRLCLYSQITGVVPEHQGRGLGERLKRAQRTSAREQGVHLIAWAFDPLQAGNAHFNLARLGAAAAHYIDDMYGPRTDDLNAGAPTDRLIAAWEIERSPHAAVDAEEARSIPRLIETTPRADGEPEPAGVRVEEEAQRLLLEIPADIKHLRRSDTPRAERWQVAVREAFHAAFRRGYRAIGFVRESRVRCAYVLHRGEEPGAATGALPSLF